jgi:hypothetical protein
MARMTTKSFFDMGPEIWKLSYGSSIYDFSGCGLTSLHGSPKIVNHSLLLEDNLLQSLSEGPSIVEGDFSIGSNRLIQSLHDGPKVVHGDYDATDCDIGMLSYVPERIEGDFLLAKNPLTSLKGINQLKEMDGRIYLDNCYIVSHILGVFFIKGCTGFKIRGSANPFSMAAAIVNRHIDKGRAGLLPCQKELIEAGLTDFAQI